MSFFKGNIYITSNLKIVYSTPFNSTTKIVSLDEDGIIADSDNILKGTCLLPPIEAKIAEADGNEYLYDTVYSNHLLSEYQYNFIGALVSYLFKVGDIILFLPETEYTNTTEKLVEHIYNRYGIYIGNIDLVNDPRSICKYDERCLPIWLNMMYLLSTLDVYEFLYLYPNDAMINNNGIINKILLEMNPYGSTINDQIDYINKFRVKLKDKPNLRPAFTNFIRRN
jgi:hypothetical protein